MPSPGTRPPWAWGTSIQVSSEQMVMSLSMAESQWNPEPGMAPMVGTSRSNTMFLMRLVSSKYWCWNRWVGSSE